MNQPPSRGHLPRLAPEFYRRFACVHWVMTVEDRATGWLDALFHARWREAMLHALVRYHLLCPVYCLMPDHVHFIWIGCSQESDQRAAALVFRRLTNGALIPQRWQLQAFDHVLRDEERKRGAFRAVCHYVMENPVRMNLVTKWAAYPYSGAIVPGLADLDPRREDFWEVLWKEHTRKVGE